MLFNVRLLYSAQTGEQDNLLLTVTQERTEKSVHSICYCRTFLPTSSDTLCKTSQGREALLQKHIREFKRANSNSSTTIQDLHAEYRKRRTVIILHTLDHMLVLMLQLKNRYSLRVALRTKKFDSLGNKNPQLITGLSIPLVMLQSPFALITFKTFMPRCRSYL